MSSLLKIFASILCVIYLVSCLEDEQVADGVEVNTSKELILYNWEEYTPLNVLDQFEKETGVKVILKTFQTLDELVSTLQSKPDMCDLLIVDTEEGRKVFEPLRLIEELDPEMFSKTQSYHSLYDRTENIGVPYCFGMVGLAVDKRYVDLAFQNYQYLLNPRFKNKISLLDEPVDLYDVSLNAVGYSVNDSSPEAHSGAVLFAKKLKMLKPVYQDVYSGLDALNEGKVWIAMAYSGEAMIYQKDNPNIEFIYPHERPLLWGDMMCVNINAPNKKNAYLFLDFINTPQVAAEVAVQFKYAPGIIGAEKYMDRESLNNPLINFPKSLIQKCEVTAKTRESKSRINEVYQILTSDDGDQP